MNNTEGIPAPQNSSRASQLLDEGKQRVGDLTGAAKERAIGQAEQRKTEIAHQLSSLSERLRGSVGDEGGIADGLIQRAADYIQQAAQGIEGRSTQELLQSLRTQVREKPALFMGSFFVAGFLATRLLK